METAVTEDGANVQAPVPTHNPQGPPPAEKGRSGK